MAKFDKFIKYKGNHVTLPKKFLVEGGREEAIQMIQRYEQGLLLDAELKEDGFAELPALSNIPSFIKQALGL
tara:strand:+ start:378 stop:593 length:216 start_codon:yes stop_codon:yes gene_type:complete